MMPDHNLPVVPEMKLELVPVPVSDVDRAKAFYVEKCGFKLEVDVQPTDTMRVVQFTPPGSAIARSALVKRGLEVGEITDIQGVKYAGFSDPDGNSWLLQEFPPELRQPGQSFSKQEA